MMIRSICLLSLFLWTSSCSKYFVSYDYFRFEDDNKMVYESKNERKTTRQNIMFENNDLKIIGILEETRKPPFTISIYFKGENDSLLINDFKIYLVLDSLISPNQAHVNIDSDKTIYFKNFNEIPIETRLQPTKIFYFGFNTPPNEDVLNLRLMLSYKIRKELNDEIIEVKGLKRRKTKKQFVGFH